MKSVKGEDHRSQDVSASYPITARNMGLQDISRMMAEVMNDSENSGKLGDERSQVSADTMAPTNISIPLGFTDMSKYIGK